MYSPYLLFLGDSKEFSAAKTAAGIKQWRPEYCMAQMRLDGCNVDLGLEDMTPEQAVAAGARTMIIGVVNVGGYIPEIWRPAILAALNAGLDVAAGMHNRLADDPVIKETADRLGRSLFDVRRPTQEFAPGSGAPRKGQRLLTVGTDCAVGKKYTALAIAKAMQERDMKADFRATGQTGIMISGRGVAIESVVSDFISGAAEWLSPENEDDHWDVVEGQGSLFHPAYAGVTLGLIHGSQPDALVICHEPIRTHLLGFNYPVPDLMDCIENNVKAAQLTNRNARAVGVSINASRMAEADIAIVVEAIEAETGLPCCDPIRHGVDKIIDHLLQRSAVTRG